jgi:hypothetical protein
MAFENPAPTKNTSRIGRGTITNRNAAHPRQVGSTTTVCEDTAILQSLMNAGHADSEEFLGSRLHGVGSHFGSPSGRPIRS